MKFHKFIKHIFLFFLFLLLGIQNTYAKTELILPLNNICFSTELNQNFKSLEKELQPNIGFLKEKSRFVIFEGISAQIPPKYYNPELSNYDDILFKISFASMIDNGYYTSYADINNNAKINFAYNCGLYNGMINEAVELVKVVAYIGKIVSEKQFRADLYEGFSSLSVKLIFDKIEKDFSGNIYEKSEQAGEYVVSIASIIIPLSKVDIAVKINSLSKIIRNLPKTAIKICKDLEAKAIKKFIFKGDDIAYFVYKELDVNIAKFDGNSLKIINDIPNDLINKNTIYTSADEISIIENGVTYNAKFEVVAGTRNGEDYVGIKKVVDAGARFIAKSGDELKTFLNGITDLPTGVTYKGKMYRYIPSQYSDAKLIVQTTTSDAGNRFRTGLYLSETKAGNIIEVNSYGGTANKTLYEFTDFEVNNLLDLTDLKTVEKLGTSFEQMKLIEVDNAYEFTQEVAIWAKNNGYSGIKFLGTQGGTVNYTNFVIFEQQVVNSSIKGSVNSISW